jgi:hypothetical protein
MQRKRVERLRFEQWFSSIRASLDKAKLAEVLGSNPASSIFLVRENWGIVLSPNFEFFSAESLWALLFMSKIVHDAGYADSVGRENLLNDKPIT